MRLGFKKFWSFLSLGLLILGFSYLNLNFQINNFSGTDPAFIAIGRDEITNTIISNTIEEVFFTTFNILLSKYFIGEPQLSLRQEKSRLDCEVKRGQVYESRDPPGPYSELWTHEKCALWSAKVCRSPNTGRIYKPN